jgi:hypothetical protein
MLRRNWGKWNKWRGVETLMCEKHFWVIWFVLFLLLHPSLVSADIVNIRLGENKIITEMNWHEMWGEAPIPSDPESLPADILEFNASGNNAHAFVSTSLSTPQWIDRESGNAHASIGAELFFEGEEGKNAMAEVTINYSYNAEVALEGGGTSHVTLVGGILPMEQIEDIACTTLNQTPPISCIKNSSDNRSQIFNLLARAGTIEKIGLVLYSHSDTGGDAVHSLIDVTINSIEIKFAHPEACIPGILYLLSD